MTNTPLSSFAADDTAPWYKNAVIYEVHVRAFADSNGDGIGDFPGLTQRLDYLQDLGVTAIWLLPFYPSPLRDDGYDIADYTSVHPAYGTLRDVRALLREAHGRGIRVITELVLNHTSDQHAWFQAARRAKPGSKQRDFYVWSDSADRYQGTRIIFKDFETSNWTWDPVAGAYFWHRFYSHQPDLNFDSPDVQKAMLRVVDFWFSMGVDGLRLDAVPYLYEREGTSSENLPETHAFLKTLRNHVDTHYRDRMLLAEANQWPAEAVHYFGQGDECHMAFHFPLMPRLFMGLYMEDRFPIVDILEQTPPIPETAQWAVFLRNHDELTLEMVTEEERDYMYRVYASNPQARINLGIRRRLAPLLGNNRRRIELMNGLLFSLPGTVVLYYGDEIGMGDNFYLGDRNGVRTPMQWSGDRNAGFSRANPQRLFLPVVTDPEYHYEALNVDAQQGNTSSLLWWMKRLIALRKRYPAFGHGSTVLLHPDNRKVLAFVRHGTDGDVLVVANLSRFAQAVELDLRDYEGAAPIELFGQTRFPRIGELPYLLTLGPHAFFWFSLERQPVGTADQPSPAGAPLVVRDRWQAVFQGRNRTALATRLQHHVVGRRWFGGKARTIRNSRILDVLPLSHGQSSGALVLFEVHYAEGHPDCYQVELGFVPATSEAGLDRRGAIADVVVRSKGGESTGVLVDAAGWRPLPQALLSTITGRRRLTGEQGQARGVPDPAVRKLGVPAELPAVVSTAEQSNTSMIYGERMILKLIRRPEAGPNPELEIGRFLTQRTTFRHTPRLLGAIEYRIGEGDPWTLAVLQEFIPNAQDLWKHTLDGLSQYYENALAGVALGAELPARPKSVIEVIRETAPDEVSEVVGPYIELAGLLGQRTAELHLALASNNGDPNFAPEPFNHFYQQGLYQGLRGEAGRVFALLRRQMESLPEGKRQLAGRVLAQERAIHGHYQSLLTMQVQALRTRYHGDFHLGQILYTGKDVIILDFEGEVSRPLSERRIKRSPLRDVAGMIRSFDYAANAALETVARVYPEHRVPLTSWSDFWSTWISHRFVNTYLATMGASPIVPRGNEQPETMLRIFLIEKAIYEMEYELNNRPDWVAVPLQGLLALLGDDV